MSNQYSYSIKDLALQDRPREKYILKGSHALTDAELIAILLRSGSRNETAIELAQHILKHFNNDLSKLSLCNYKQLKQFRGIGDTKAITLLAAFEIGKRRQHINNNLTKIHNSSDVDSAMRIELEGLKHEEFWILLLDHQNHIIEKHRSSKGGLTSTTVDLRLIIREAMIHSATQIILVHNHPSGSLTPSKQDLDITLKINNGLKIVDIKLLDHLIITNDNYFSMADHGILSTI
ncbi:DNA repair protein RadC [Halosquirtibacter xylanolyticus]|uniref:RadC family protein n=1 Tax=Halosquirtibacter xylanolyticus TaxID=3374599 RepID=UPI003748547F|nr:DNA repair protein RadC [Prolixibacteraceae bacterium]